MAKYAVTRMNGEGDAEYEKRLKIEARGGADLKSVIEAASKTIAESEIGKNPLDGGRPAPIAFQTRIPDRGPLGDREAHMKAGLNPNSLLKAGSSNVFHKDPTSGRVRASRPGDAPETLFQVG